MQIAIFAVFGLFVGILVNRAADTLPSHQLELVLRAPQCQFCGTPRAPIDQFALLSYVLLRGRCANCQAPIPLRAPIVELASAVAFSFLGSRFAGSFFLILALVYSTVLLLVLVTDLEHRLILNVVILPATLLAILASPLSPLGWTRSLLGGAIAYFLVYLIYIFARLFARVRHHSIKVPFGFGDVKLAGFVGLLAGFPDVFTAILFAILLGGLGAMLFLIYQAVVYKRLALGAAIPYGPFFCIAGWLLMVWR